MVMEDILNTKQRPKVEFFPDYVFITSKMVKLDQNRMGDIEQVSLILGKGFVISFQEWKGDVFDPIRDRIRTHRGKIREKGADYLAYALIDSIVDNYFPVLGSLSDEMDRIEENLRKDLKEKDLKRIHSIRRSIVSLKRAIWPLREGVSNLMREDSPLISEEVHPFLRDIYDHTIQVMDNVDSMRDVSTGLMELYMSLSSNRMNEIMKVLTIIATIFIPLTFIAGIYGMNFNTDSSPLNMPELEWYFGYPLALLVMLMMSIGMVIYFKRKRWL
jgi:magnesium transporter